MVVQREGSFKASHSASGIENFADSGIDDPYLVSNFPVSITNDLKSLNGTGSTSIDHAEESTRTLTTGIQLLLRSNLNMSRRLRNIERMHPALATSSCPSKASSTLSLDVLQSEPRTIDSLDIHFEEALGKSPAYKRAGFSRLMVSKASSTISPGPSFLSGLSLGDVDNVSAVALPISSRELWNHHRYVAVKSGGAKAGAQALDAWYNPPPTVRPPHLSPRKVTLERLTCAL